jgi:hypothetical protein
VSGLVKDMTWTTPRTVPTSSATSTPAHGEQPQAPERAIAGRGRTAASDDDPTTALDHRQSGRRRGRAYPRTSSGHRGFPPAATASKESPVPWSDKLTVEALARALAALKSPGPAGG